MTFDVDMYTITVRKEQTEDGLLFVGRVAEIPDVMALGENYKEAYEMARNVVSDLYDAAVEEGRAFPKPAETKSTDYSGRFTLRLAKSLHRQLDAAAQAEHVSMNQFAITAITAAVYARMAFPDIDVPTPVATKSAAATSTVKFVTYSYGYDTHIGDSDDVELPISWAADEVDVMAQPAALPFVYKEATLSQNE